LDAHTFCFSAISGRSNQQTSHKHPNLNIRDFLNCGLKCLALGRLGDDFEEREETRRRPQAGEGEHEIPSRSRGEGKRRPWSTAPMCSRIESGLRTGGRLDGRLKRSMRRVPKSPRARHGHIERHRSAEFKADRCMSSKPNHSRSSSAFCALALGYLSLHQVSDHAPRALHES